MPSRRSSKRLGERLIERGLINEAAIKRATVKQRESGTKIGQALIDLGIVREADLLPILSEHIGTPVIDLSQEVPDPSVIQLVPEDFARDHYAIPVRRENGHVRVAMSDPADFKVVDKLQSLTGSSVLPLLAPRTEILKAISK